MKLKSVLPILTCLLLDVSAVETGQDVDSANGELALQVARARVEKEVSSLPQLREWSRSDDVKLRTSARTTLAQITGQWGSQTDLIWGRSFKGAKGQGKPILLLQLFGNLDEEFCSESGKLARTMTFSDDRIVEALKRDWIPVWQSVSKVAEGKKVRGEVALLFCDEKGQVFDILPTRQSPTATLEAIQKAHAFHKSQKGVMTRKNVRSYHLTEMRKVLNLREGKQHAVDDLYSADEVIGGIELGFNLDPQEEVAVAEMSRIEASEVFPQAALATDPSESVDPGYYRWQVRRGFCGIVPNSSPASSELKSWDAALRSPDEWKRPLFEAILKQPLGDGKFEFNFDSLKSLKLIND